MNIIFAALSFCLVVIGAVLTFAVHAGNLDGGDAGIVLLVLGGLAFVFTASRLWFIEEHDRKSRFQAVNMVFVVALSFSLLALGAVLTFALHNGRIDGSDVGVILLVLVGIAFVLAGTRLGYIDHRQRWQQRHRYVTAFIPLVLLSFGLLVVGAILTFAIHAGGLAVGVILLVLGCLTFLLATSQLWSADRSRPRRQGGPAHAAAAPRSFRRRPSPNR